MGIVVQGLLAGILATLGMDAWAGIVKYVLRLPTAHWDLVGRWIGHMRRGRFVHESIADSQQVPHELLIGWITHYFTGIAYGIAYLAIVQGILGRSPSLVSALVFGLVTLAAPWLILQPGMGAGVFASRTPRPGLVRLVNLSMHLVFGASLYAAWTLL